MFSCLLVYHIAYHLWWDCTRRALPFGWQQFSLLDAPGSAFRLARGSTETIDLCFPTYPILSHFHPSLCPQRHDAFRQDRTDRPLAKEEPYQDLGPDYFRKQDKEQQARRFVHQLETLGYRVELASQEEVTA